MSRSIYLARAEHALRVSLAEGHPHMYAWGVAARTSGLAADEVTRVSSGTRYLDDNDTVRLTVVGRLLFHVDEPITRRVEPVPCATCDDGRNPYVVVARMREACVEWQRKHGVLTDGLRHSGFPERGSEIVGHVGFPGETEVA